MAYHESFEVLGNLVGTPPAGMLPRYLPTTLPRQCRLILPLEFPA